MSIDFDALSEKLTENSPIVILVTPDQFGEQHVDVWVPGTEDNRSVLTINTDKFEEDLDGILDTLDGAGYTQLEEVSASEYIIEVGACECGDD